MVVPDCDLSWSKVLPHEVGVWIECGAQCDEVCAYRGAGRNCRPRNSYLDDIFVNEDVVSVQCVENHLLRYGLECKPAERVADGARVLGLEVLGRARRATLEASETTHSARFRTR